MGGAEGDPPPEALSPLSPPPSRAIFHAMRRDPEKPDRPASRLDRAEALFEDLASGEAGSRGIAAASFAESTIVPIPIEALAVPLMASRPERAMRWAWALLLGSLLGASTLYLLAFAFQDAIPGLAAWLGGEELYREAQARLSAEGVFLAVFLISVSFAPMQLAALGAGAAGGSFPAFLLAILLSRGIRYFGLALACRALGRRVEVLRRSRAATVAAAMLGVLALWGAGMALGVW